MKMALDGIRVVEVSTWVAAPLAEDPIAAGPHVASPAEPLGDCDFGQRLLIANVVVIGRSHIVVLSRFGGLSGP